MTLVRYCPELPFGHFRKVDKTNNSKMKKNPTQSQIETKYKMPKGLSI